MLPHDSLNETESHQPEGDIESATAAEPIIQPSSSSELLRPKSKSYANLTLYDGTNMSVRVLSQSRQPKRKGKDGDWLNVHVQGEHDPISVCWKDVVSWNEIPEYEETLLLTSVDEMNQEILDAKAKELRNLKHNNVFEEVDYTSIQINPLSQVSECLLRR